MYDEYSKGNTEFSKDAYNEELFHMNKDKFVSIVKETKSFLKSSIDDLKKVKKTGNIEVHSGLILIPNKYVLFFEDFFKKLNLKKRLNIFYYEGTPYVGLNDAISKCRKNAPAKDLPKKKYLRVFDSENLVPLGTG